MTSTRNSSRTRWGLTLLAIGLVFAWAHGTSRDLDAEDLSVRERWSRLSVEERERLRDRYETYQQMGESEQRELAERARNVRGVRRRLLRRLTEEEVEQLKALDAPTRDALVAEMVEDELRNQGRRLHALLPEDLREQIERADPTERRALLVEFKATHRPRMSLVAIDSLGHQLGKTDAQLRAWKSEPESERLVRIVALHKELAERSIEETGLPAGITAQRWAQIQDLEPEDFFDQVLRIRREIARERRQARKPQEKETYADRRRAAAMEIVAGLRSSPRERLELSNLPPAERREQIARDRRDRILVLLEEHQALPPELLADFRDMPEDEFYGNVRRIVRESGVLRKRGLDEARDPAADEEVNDGDGAERR